MAKKAMSKPASPKTPAKSSGKTATKKSTPIPSLEKDQSIRIEKIDNGYLAVKEIYDQKKGYHTKKVFMEKNPLENL